MPIKLKLIKLRIEAESLKKYKIIVPASPLFMYPKL